MRPAITFYISLKKKGIFIVAFCCFLNIKSGHKHEATILQHIVVEKYFAGKLSENLHLIHLYTQNTKADDEN
jgi:hypothetical protein